MLENLYYSVTGKVHPIPAYAHLIRATVARGGLDHPTGIRIRELPITIDKLLA